MNAGKTRFTSIDTRQVCLVTDIVLKRGSFYLFEVLADGEPFVVHAGAACSLREIDTQLSLEST